MLLFLFVVPFITSVLLYSNTLSAGFVWDDRVAIIKNQDVYGVINSNPLFFENLGELFRHDFWGENIALNNSHKSYRPLTVLSFRLDAFISQTVDDAFQYHLSNILLHGLLSGLVCLFIFDVLRDKMSALLGGILFGIHSIHVEAVASLVGRADILCGIFFLLSIWVYERKLFGSSLFFPILFSILGTLCKEQAITSLGYCLFESMMLSRNYFQVSVMIIVISILLKLRLDLHQGASLYKWTIFENHISIQEDIMKRIFSYMHVHYLYAFLLFFPIYLCFDHGYDTIPIRENGPSIESIVAYVTLCSIFMYSLIKWDILLLKGLIMTIFPFIPASHLFFPVGAVIAERLLYTPSIGFSFLFSLFYKRTNKQKYKYLLKCIIGVYFIGLVVKTYQRNLDWYDEKSLFLSAIQVEPRSVRALNNYAFLMLRGNREDLMAGEIYLLRAIEILPNYATAYFNLGITYRLLGKQDLAIVNLEKAIYHDPTHCHAGGLLGDVMGTKFLQENNDDKSYLEKAISTLEKYTKICKIPYAEMTLAKLEMKRNGGPTLEVIHKMESFLLDENRLDVSPTDLLPKANICNDVGLAYKEMGKVVEAVESFEKGLQFDSENMELLCNCASGWIDLDMRHGENAKYTYPNGTTQSSLDRAKMFLSQAMEIYGFSEPLVVANYGWYHEHIKDFKQAKFLYEKALELLPGHEKIKENIKRVNLKI